MIISKSEETRGRVLVEKRACPSHTESADIFKIVLQISLKAIINPSQIFENITNYDNSLVKIVIQN